MPYVTKFTLYIVSDESPCDITVHNDVMIVNPTEVSISAFHKTSDTRKITRRNVKRMEKKYEQVNTRVQKRGKAKVHK